MKKFVYPILSIVLLAVSTATVYVTAPSYKISEGYSIQFKSKDPSGEFKVMKGIVKFSEEDLSDSKFDLSFDVNSISTGNGMKNKKAQTAEWFDAAKYPKITFVSTKVEKSGSDYVVVGNLKIKGVSKEQRVPLKVKKNGNDLVFTGDFKVNRIDYKVGKKSNVVPDIMNISYSIPVSKN